MAYFIDLQFHDSEQKANITCGRLPGVHFTGKLGRAGGGLCSRSRRGHLNLAKRAAEGGAVRTHIRL
jgi:hypothetical protein